MGVTSAYKQTEGGPVPTDWEVSSLGNHCALITKGTTPTSIGRAFCKAGVNFVKTESVAESGRLMPDKIAYIDSQTHSLLSRSQLRKDDILISIAGVLGRVALVDEADLPANTNQALAIVRLAEESSLERIFLFHALRSRIVARQINGVFVQAAQSNISLQDVRELQLPLPPPLEQRAIAAALSDVDALLAGLERLIAKKRDLKQAAMQQLLTGKTRLPGFVGEWEVRRLGEVAALHRVNVVPALQPQRAFLHYSLPAFDAGKSAQVELGSSIGSSKFAVPRGAVLVSKLNPRIPRVWAPLAIPDNAVASTEWLVLTPRDDVERQYLFMLCSSPAFCEKMEASATGTTGSHQRISPSAALNIRLDVAPDPSEQSAIAAVLSDMDAELFALQARRDKTRALKQGMMQELLTGRTRLV